MLKERNEDEVVSNLEPIGILGALLGSEDLNEALVLVTTHNVAGISPGEMAVERRGIELGEHIDLGDVTVEAVTDGDIDQPVISSEGNRGLCSLLRQRVQTGPSAASQYNPQHTLENNPDLVFQTNLN